MKWSGVGEWLKKNGGKGVSLIGSLATGNIPGALATGISMIQSATGTDDPEKALKALQDPDTMLKLKEMYYKNEDSIREHLREMNHDVLEDNQKAHHEQQETIRGGDVAFDKYVRRTRPLQSRQSWWATMLYIIGMELLKALDIGSGAEFWLASILISPAGAYMGFRTLDKIKGKPAK